METEQIIGTWRTTKIHWHSDQISNYSDTDNWQQYVFAAGGVLNEYGNYYGLVHRFINLSNWRIERNEIILNTFNTWDTRVVSLTDDSLILKPVNTGITYYLKKIPDVLPVQ